MSSETNVAEKQMHKTGVKMVVQVGMLAALALILMFFEIPLPFAPAFYEIDFSEVPVLIGCFTMGPMAVSYTHLDVYKRQELLKVAKLGPKAFEQCAGFMRIQGGKNPLDATGVHPESYGAAEKLLKKQGFKPEDITGGNLTGRCV